jgi:hypothetical protein
MKPMSDIEKRHVLELADGLTKPKTSIEKHFILLCADRVREVEFPREKLWYEYWITSTSKNISEPKQEPDRKGSEVKVTWKFKGNPQANTAGYEGKDGNRVLKGVKRLQELLAGFDG